jgi:SH3 domain protein
MSPVNKITFISLVLFLSAPLLSLPAYAQDRYISDVLYVPLRSGKGNEFRIVHRGLPSGTKLALIREEPDSSGELWSLVSMPNGEEGWVRNQFLVDEPIAALKLADAERRAADLENRRVQLQREVNELRAENTALQNQLSALQGEHEQLAAETDSIRKASAGALTLQEQHRELHEAYQLLQTRADVMQAENQMLKKDRRYHEWLIGGGILLFGVLLSFILQAMGKRRRGSEWR